jgi:C4-type Zn-finger protein
MMIDTERPSCPNCGAEIEKTSQFVADETPDDLVVACYGVCSCDYRKEYQWHEHYGYKGYTGMKTVVKK